MVADRQEKVNHGSIVRDELVYLLGDVRVQLVVCTRLPRSIRERKADEGKISESTVSPNYR